jgi:thiosulfate/3-mercaptopyruvate sulfurtransferase
MSTPFLNPLVTPDELEPRLDDPAVRVIDATVWLELDPDGGPPQITSGREAWSKRHIPGADFADLIELSDPVAPERFMLPSAESFADAMSALGVGPGIHVVTYDTAGTMWATRLWWMLRVFGFETVSVLDGGLRGWLDAGGVTSDAIPSAQRADFEPTFRPELVAVREDVSAAINSSGTCLVNALPAPLFRGDVPILPGRAGHIPSSSNVPHNEIIDPETGRLATPDQLRDRFSAAGVLDKERIIAYCGGGIAATLDAFALSLLGRDDVAVYDGSMVEWAGDPTLPLDRG